MTCASSGKTNSNIRDGHGWLIIAIQQRVGTVVKHDGPIGTRKTMKSFFNATSSKTSSLGSNRAGSNLGTQKDSQFVSPHPTKAAGKKQITNSSKGPAKKKAKTGSISSFFQKKTTF